MNYDLYKTIKYDIIDKSINNTNTNNNGGVFCREHTMEFMDTDKRTENLEIIQNVYKNNLDISIYRYKFTEDFMIELYNFSKIHQYDDRKVFKEAWNVWIEKNEEIIVNETNRLVTLGYDGDIMDKMFKSARYYFRKKDTKKNEPKERRNYVSVHRELLEEMDSHIKSKITESFKPSEGYDHFCNSNKELLKEEIRKLLENKLSSTEIMEKIKKTYKNRYFMLISK